MSRPFALSFLACTSLATTAQAQDSTGDLLKKLNNPVSDIRTLPLENDWTFGPGPEGDATYTLNVQPVVPFPLNDDWLVISRTIVPVVWAENAGGPDKDVWGIGDTEATFFLSPKHLKGDVLWGIGPTVFIPTATDMRIGTNQWGGGLSGVAVWQKDGCTLGGLVNYVGTFGDDQAVSESLIDPWISHSSENGFGWKVESETTYDFTTDAWTVPLEFGLSQLVTLGKQPVNFGGDLIWYAQRADTDPEWAVRFTVNFIFTQ